MYSNFHICVVGSRALFHNCGNKTVVLFVRVYLNKTQVPFHTSQMLIDTCQMLMTSWHRPLRWTSTWRRWWWSRPLTARVRLHPPRRRRRIYWWRRIWNSLGERYLFCDSIFTSHHASLHSSLCLFLHRENIMEQTMESDAESSTILSLPKDTVLGRNCVSQVKDNLTEQ